MPKALTKESRSFKRKFSAPLKAFSFNALTILGATTVATLAYGAEGALIIGGSGLASKLMSSAFREKRRLNASYMDRYLKEDPKSLSADEDKWRLPALCSAIVLTGTFLTHVGLSDWNSAPAYNAANYTDDFLAQKILQGSAKVSEQIDFDTLDWSRLSTSSPYYALKTHSTATVSYERFGVPHQGCTRIIKHLDGKINGKPFQGDLFLSGWYHCPNGRVFPEATSAMPVGPTRLGSDQTLLSRTLIALNIGQTD